LAIFLSRFFDIVEVFLAAVSMRWLVRASHIRQPQSGQRG
jgi:hypothetical protein